VSSFQRSGRRRTRNYYMKLVEKKKGMHFILLGVGEAKF
jgi:hypothetical protein